MLALRIFGLIVTGGGILLAQPAGDTARGQALFEGKGDCLSCHRVNGEGSRLGPDLSDTGARNKADYLERALLDPDADVAPANRFVKVVTKDGTAITGRILNQDNFTLQFIDAQGKLRSFMRSDLRESTLITKSQMPPYKDKLSAQEVADLVAYMLTLKGIGKQ